MKQHLRLIFVIGLLLVLSLSLMPLAAQESGLPSPTGPYQIGRTTRYWLDESRYDFLTLPQEGTLQPGTALAHTSSLVKADAKTRSATVATTEVGQLLNVTEVQKRWAHVEYGEISGWVEWTNLVNVDPAVVNDPAHKRNLVVRIWYPADTGVSGSPAMYMGDFSGPLAEQAIALWGLDGSNPQDQKLIKLQTHAYLDVPVAAAQTKYPVVIVSPGAFPEQFTAQAEELASHGYIVVGINHEYRKIFPDGHVGGYASPVDLILDEPMMAQDIEFVANQLEAVNANDPEGMFTGRFDLERLGLVGYSSSGGAVAIAASEDKRFRAVVSYDGDPLPSGYAELDQPYLFLTTESGQVMKTVGPTYVGAIKGFYHQSFVDFPYWWAVGTWSPAPPPTADVLASVDPRGIEIVRAYTLGFFDKVFEGADVPLLNGPSGDFPEVGFQTLNLQ